MRLLPGQPADMAGQSITSYSLVKNAINNPDVLPRVWELFEEEISPLSAILSKKGLKTNNLFDGMNTSNYRVVKSNHVQYPIKNSDKRKLHFVANASGVAFVSDQYPTKPGFMNTPFYFWLDSNWARPNEVIELGDNRTQIFIYDQNEPEPDTFGWRYEGKLVGGIRESYVEPDLMIANAEAGVVSVLYEQDFSETGSEKYTFDGWGHAYMTLQRVKMSWSGTAKAMGESKEWHAFQNAKGTQVNTYIEYAEKAMLKRMAEYHEYATIFGKGTVAEDGQVLLKDKRGREIMSGDGILNQGDGAYEYPMNGEWTIRQLESIMADTDARSGKDGKIEIVMLNGLQSNMSFSRMMAAAGFKTQNNNVEGSGSEKGLNMDYGYYEIAGIRIINKRYRYLDNLSRPSQYLPDGTRRSSWDSIIVPIGMTTAGDNGIELVQLRPATMGTVSGIDKGGEMASSVDGSSKHLLVQSGVISRNKISRVFRISK